MSAGIIILLVILALLLGALGGMFVLWIKIGLRTRKAPKNMIELIKKEKQEQKEVKNERQRREENKKSKPGRGKQTPKASLDTKPGKRKPGIRQRVSVRASHGPTRHKRRVELDKPSDLSAFRGDE